MMTEPFFEKPEPPRWPEPIPTNPNGAAGMASLSVILGVIGIFTFALACFGGLAGLLLGLVAFCLPQNKEGEDHRFLALTGIGLNLLALVVMVLVLAPGTLAARRSANDESARKSLRAIHSAQMAYARSHGGNFTANLADLDLEPTIREMDTKVKSGFRLGKITVTAADGFHPARFSVTAEPATPHGVSRTGNTSFYVDDSGLIRQSGNSDVPATAASEPVRE